MHREEMVVGSIVIRWMLVIALVVPMGAVPAAATEAAGVGLPDGSTVAGAGATLSFVDLSTLALSGSASRTSRGIRLTPAGGESTGVGGAFIPAPVSLGADYSFSTSYTVEIGDASQPPADGMAFVLQAGPPSASPLQGGGYLGYGGRLHSIGVELDTYQNWSDPVSNHVGINLGGSLDSVAAVALPFDVATGAPIYVWVEYDGVTDLLQVRVSQIPVRPPNPTLLHAVDLASELGTSQVYAGFTAGTAMYWAYHDVTSWGLSCAPYRPSDRELLMSALRDLRDATLYRFDEDILDVAVTQAWAAKTRQGNLSWIVGAQGWLAAGGELFGKALRGFMERFGSSVGLTQGLRDPKTPIASILNDSVGTVEQASTVHQGGVSEWLGLKSVYTSFIGEVEHATEAAEYPVALSQAAEDADELIHPGFGWFSGPIWELIEPGFDVDAPRTDSAVLGIRDQILNRTQAGTTVRCLGGSAWRQSGRLRVTGRAANPMQARQAIVATYASLMASIPPTLPPGFPMDETVSELRGLTSSLRLEPAADAVAVYSDVPTDAPGCVEPRRVAPGVIRAGLGQTAFILGSISSNADVKSQESIVRAANGYLSVAYSVMEVESAAVQPGLDRVVALGKRGTDPLLAATNDAFEHIGPALHPKEALMTQEHEMLLALPAAESDLWTMAQSVANRVGFGASVDTTIVPKWAARPVLQYPARAELWGTVRDSRTGQPVPGAKVQLLRTYQAGTDVAWAFVDIDTADSRGVFQFSAAPKRNARYRVQLDPMQPRRAWATQPCEVRVKARLTVNSQPLVARDTAGRRVAKFKFTVSPSHEVENARTVVYLQKRSADGRWQRLTNRFINLTAFGNGTPFECRYELDSSWRLPKGTYRFEVEHGPTTPPSETYCHALGRVHTKAFVVR